MTFTAILLGAAATAIALLRWLRVAQREHYLAGSSVTAAWRWIRVRPPNGALALLVVAGIGAAVGVDIAGHSAVAIVASCLLVVIAAVFPWPMRVLGRPRLRWTRRAVTLLTTSVVIAGGAAAALGSAMSVAVAMAVVACAAPAIVDGAAAVASPFERMALERHRRKAEARLARVGPFVIAVTGSWGKTSTKNHIRDLLAGSADVVASPASYNNTAGLARTMNEHLTDSTEVLVVEMGMYRPGEIRELCSWVKPNIAVICAVGPMHLERAGSIDAIVAGKAEILERADAAVLWVDDPNLAALADAATVSKVWSVGARGGDRLDVEVEVVADEVIVWVAGGQIGACPLAAGVHPANVGCAVAAALAYGATPRQIAQRLPTLSAPPHRATVQSSDSGVVIIDDTFNSNPAGAAAALATLGRLSSGRRAVVTPGMVEMGALQDEQNRELAEAVVASGATLVVVGWTNRRQLVTGANGEAIVVRDREDARRWVRGNLGEGDGVLWENDLPDHYA